MPDDPEFVYHYTTQRGLMGMTRDSEIWASDILYLNDAAEFNLTLKLARSAIEEMPDFPKHLCGLQRPLNLVDMMGYPAMAVYDALLSAIERIPKFPEHICVCSFSTKSDSLSQWRGYGHGGVAYSIGFPVEALRQLAQVNEFQFTQCLYSRVTQGVLVRRLVQATIESLSNIKKESQWTGELSDFLLALLNFAPIIKDESFSEEQEWRLSSPPIAATHDRLDFRPGISMLVPYFRFPLTRDGKLIKIDKITVGPCPHPELSVASVKAFLMSKGLEHVEVEPSKVPYRNW